MHTANAPVNSYIQWFSTDLEQARYHPSEEVKADPHPSLNFPRIPLVPDDLQTTGTKSFQVDHLVYREHQVP
jgi:hypothetical protein